jgi:hypothetical protein
MPTFIVNKNPQPTSRQEHEVHNLDRACGHLPWPENNRINLGWHTNCREALVFARTKYPNHVFDGCYWCANECHTI